MNKRDLGTPLAPTFSTGKDKPKKDKVDKVKSDGRTDTYVNGKYKSSTGKARF